MALQKGINSYVSVADAEAYFADRLDVAAWTEASDTDKARALVTATGLLDNLIWKGVAVSESQSLAFPRDGSYFEPRLGYLVTLTSEVPKRILTATYEYAYHLLNNDGLLDDTGRVSSINVGPITLTDIKNSNEYPDIVASQIKPLLAAKSSGWWRAN